MTEKKPDQVTSLTQGLIHRLPATQGLASPRVQFGCPTNNGRITVVTQACFFMVCPGNYEENTYLGPRNLPGFLPSTEFVTLPGKSNASGLEPRLDRFISAFPGSAQGFGGNGWTQTGCREHIDAFCS